MSQIWKYMDRKLNSEELPTMKELLSEIEENGGTDAALAGLREKQYRQYCCELIWRYPISQGDSAGGFLMPVREGILWIPYDAMEKEAGEILRTCDAVLMDETACAAYGKTSGPMPMSCAAPSDRAPISAAVQDAGIMMKTSST